MREGHDAELEGAQTPLRRRLYVIIFEAETAAGRLFDVALLTAIAVSVAAVMIETLPDLPDGYRSALHVAEWLLTGLFTLEYVLRLVCVRHPLRYARSFFGVVDLLAILPTYLSVFVPGAQTLIVIRALRLLRAFRVLKLARLVGGADLLLGALGASRHKVAVFLGTVAIVVVILGSAIYVVEGPENGFTSIPISVYWAIVTVTTVGYGDIAPHTALGKIIASVAMILGYAIIAVPTGIVTAELVQADRDITTRTCSRCLTSGLSRTARYCEACGGELAPFRSDRPAHGDVGANP